LKLLAEWQREFRNLIELKPMAAVNRAINLFAVEGALANGYEIPTELWRA
jgi:hypothetical protein